ncbi:MAG: hypothetical protein NZ958_01625 [Bacteroidia bacterium]|nr:hypothetical protein [Bacteroidia bacterium]MDW8089364.1 hypothetical protein [Bacteroidia bacterium]
MYRLGLLGLLVGWVLAQKDASIPREKLVAYDAVVLLRDYKPGADPYPYAEALRQRILQKVGFHHVEFKEGVGQRLALRLYTIPEMPLSDIYEVLRASGAEVHTLTPHKPETSPQTR